MCINSIFVKIWNININKYKTYEDLHIPKSIPKNLLFFLLSDGSCSRNLAALQGINMNIQLKNQEILFTRNNNFINIYFNKQLNRTVWITNNNITKVAFAKSYWQVYNNEYNILYQENNKPIGKILIESEKDIHRNIQNIYCGYSTLLTNELNHSNLLWGRSYSIVLSNKITILMHEIFSEIICTLIIILYLSNSIHCLC